MKKSHGATFASSSESNITRHLSNGLREALKLDVIKMFNKLGSRKALTQAKTLFIDKKQLEFEVLVSRWSMKNQTFRAAWGEFGPFWRMWLTSLPVFRDTYVVGVSLKGEDNKKLDFLNKLLSNLGYSANRASYLS